MFELVEFGALLEVWFNARCRTNARCEGAGGAKAALELELEAELAPEGWFCMCVACLRRSNARRESSAGLPLGMTRSHVF